MLAMYAILSRQGAILAGEDSINLERPAEAVEPLRKALDLTEEAARKSPNDYTSRSRLGTAARNLGNVLYRREPKGALEVYDLGIRRLAEIPANFLGRRIRALLLAKSSYPLRSPHRGTEAKQRIDADFVILKETKDYPAERIRPDSAAYTALCALADYQADQGELQSAIEIYKQLLDKVMASQPDSLNDLWDTTSVSRLYQALASLYRRTGGSVQAESMAARQRELWRHWNRKLPNSVFVRRQLEAASLQ